MSDDPEHLPKVTKGRHRHASGYVEREGAGRDDKPKHQHADGTVHEDHAVAPNEYGLDERDWWEGRGGGGRAAALSPVTNRAQSRLS